MQQHLCVPGQKHPTNAFPQTHAPIEMATSSGEGSKPRILKPVLVPLPVLAALLSKSTSIAPLLVLVSSDVVVATPAAPRLSSAWPSAAMLGCLGCTWEKCCCMPLAPRLSGGLPLLAPRLRMAGRAAEQAALRKDRAAAVLVWFPRSHKTPRDEVGALALMWHTQRRRCYALVGGLRCTSNCASGI